MIEKRWNEKEIKKLIRMYPYLTNKDLSKILNRTVSSIQHKASRLNLKKDNDVNKLIMSKAKEGEKSSSWKGGRKTNKDGYILLLRKDHPNSDKNGYIFEHRIVMEEYIGRLLQQNEIVHHKNGIKNDNRIENLELMTNSQHTIKHHTGSVRTKETKKKISDNAKARFTKKTNHPCYKTINIKEMKRYKESGKTINEVCDKFGISYRTYYNKLNELKEDA